MIKKEADPKGLLHQFFRKCPYTYCACYKRIIRVYGSVSMLLKTERSIVRIVKGLKKKP
nr:MAG TPA_asm: hypothetical protein [Caudoviricetes sp.]